ncbi:MAG: HAMP domain-containing histidine kinase [Salinibacterium sp.]|nr:HAMP domain-containing histidine kinase [Salinibacterium sp.]
MTIRARITGGSLVIAILISIVVGIIIFSQVQRIVHDGQVRVLENVEGPYLAALSHNGTVEVDPPGAGQLVAVVAPNDSVRVDTLPDVLTADIESILARPDETRTVSISGKSFLVRVTTVTTDAGVWSVISANLNEPAASILNQVAVLLIASIAGINLAFAAASWFIGTAALGPVGQLRRSAATLVSSPGRDLLPVGPAQDEISELASTLNQLISQFRASADRERQVVSDASHEFRTPLSIIQTQLELAQRQATTLPQMQSDVAAAQRTLARLSALATSMLELSRIDAQVAPGSATGAELAAELSEAADRGRQRVGHRDIRIEYSSDLSLAEQTISVSDADFGRVCDNLVNNALAATGGEGLIELHLALDADVVRLRVSDTAGGMDVAFVPQAFDRFSRADPARTSGGAGLGLSIVAGIVSVAGGRIELENVPGVGLAVDVTFPLSRGCPAARSSMRTKSASVQP